jgi:thiazolinyl imide reductase
VVGDPESSKSYTFQVQCRRVLLHPAMFMRPVRVLICGTNYGQIYIQAIRQAPKLFELAGILARGSPRSIEVARECGVPLYQGVESLAGDIDIACAAMGTSGADAVLRLLERGIHVLCEHPQKPDFIDTAMRSAARHGTCFHVNGHFASLKAASAFINHCNLVRQSADPTFFDVMVTDRSLYGALDIMRRVTETFQPFGLSARDHFSPFTAIQGAMGRVPATFQVQHSGNEGHIALQDGDPKYIVDYRLAVGFPQGVLTMLSIAGPVIWNSNFSRSSGMKGPMWTTVCGGPITSFDLYKQRVTANLDAVRCLVKSAREHVIPAEQTRSHILEVSLVWERIGALICCHL